MDIPTTSRIGRVDPVRRLTLGGRLFRTAACLIAIGIGAVGAAYLCAYIGGCAAQRSWTEVDCEIVRSEVPIEPDGRRWRLEVEYRYAAEGNSRVGKVWKEYPGGVPIEDIAALERVSSRFPVGLRTRCLVHPRVPDRTVLEPVELSLLALWIAWLTIPLIFFAVGVLLLAGTWNDLLRARFLRFLSPPLGSRRALVLGCAASSVFIAFGIGFLLPITIVPAVRAVAARSWTETTCTVLGSGLRSGGRRGTRPWTLFEYQAAGRTRHSSRYWFSVISTSFGGFLPRDPLGKEGIVGRNRPGTRTACWVNPRDPWDAVLDRGMPADTLFGILPAAMVTVGVVTLRKSIRGGGSIR